MSKYTRFVVLALALLLTLVGGVSAQDKKVLVTGRQMGATDIPTLDPSIAQDVPSVQVITELFPELGRLHEEKVEVQPGMATWTVSDDGLVYTFKIMQNVSWVRYNADTGAVEEVKDASGNVRHVMAQDFVLTFQRTLDPKSGSDYSGILAPWVVGGAEFQQSSADASDDERKALIDNLGIKAIDDYTLELRVPKASAAVQSIISMWVTTAEPGWTIEEFGDAWILPENINTYGPYALKSWTRGDGGDLTLVKNPFWQGTDAIPAAKIDEVKFVFLDSEPQLANFEAGTLDVSEVPASSLDRIKADPQLSTQRFVGPGTCTYYYGFNVNMAPFDDVRVRRAFSMAIDRQSIIDNILKAGQQPAGFFSLPSLVAAPKQEDYPGLGIQTDVEAAKTLFAEYLADTGKTAADVPVTILHNDSATHAAIAQAIQQQWNKAFGVDTQITVLDFATYLDTRGDYPVYRAGWCFDYPDTNNFLYDNFHVSNLAANDTHWTNPDFDKLIEDAAVASDAKTRTDLYAQAEDILVNKEAAIAPIYFYVTQDLTATGIERTHSVITREYYEKWDITR